MSGSGKSSLIRGILKKGVGEATEKKGKVVWQKNYKLTNGDALKVIEVTQVPLVKLPAQLQRLSRVGPH